MGGMTLGQVIEAMLISSETPMSAAAIAAAIRRVMTAGGPKGCPPELARVSAAATREELRALKEEYSATGRAFSLLEVAGGWKICSRPEFAPFLRELFPGGKRKKLSLPALETLAIIAYRQPITRAEIEDIRGVGVDALLQKLAETGMIRASREPPPSRTLLYSTTGTFLERFGIRRLEELPGVPKTDAPRLEI